MEKWRKQQSSKIINPLDETDTNFVTRRQIDTLQPLPKQEEAHEELERRCTGCIELEKKVELMLKEKEEMKEQQINKIQVQ